MKRYLLALATLSLCSVEGATYALTRVSQYIAYTPHSLSACGRTGIRGPQIAASPDLFRRLGGCGTRVKVTLANGQSRNYTLWDKTNRRYTNTVDVLVYNRRAALQFGITTGHVTVLK